MRLSNTQLETLRTRPQQTKLHLSIFQPEVVFRAQVNNASAAIGDIAIPYDNNSFGLYTHIEANMTLLVGTAPGLSDRGKVRVRSVTSNTLTVSENSNVDWQDNLYLTVLRYWELWPIYPRIIQNPSNAEDVIFYKDYDIVYTNQNTVLGSFVNAGPHRAAWLDPATGQVQLYYSSTGTHNVKGDSMTYQWFFGGATVTGSTSANPGYITYNTPGHYYTRLIVTNASGGTDTTYRYVSIYNAANPPPYKWSLDSIQGSRSEGGYRVSIKLHEIAAIQEHAVVVLFAENWYGDTKVSLGGNYPNSGGIFFAGYVDKDSISYDYEHSEVTFDAVSLTDIMKRTSGFSVSVKSVADPAAWYELLDMDSRRALYHYLRWHTTALQLADFQFVGNDYKVQFYDSDRESMYDAIANYMQNALIGEVVSDRQGKVWMEVQAMAYPNPTGTFTPELFTLSNRDWRNQPTIEERLTNDVSYLEYGGVAYSGVVTGTFAALIGSAPGASPGFYGGIDNHQGMVLEGQLQLNQLTGHIFANKNSPYPTVNMDLANNATNLDIAPQETVRLIISPSDTVRNVAIDSLYIPSGMDWDYDAENSMLLPSVDLQQLVNGKIGQTVVIPDVEDIGAGWSPSTFNLPPMPTVFMPSVNEAGDTAPAKVLVHDPTSGLIYTQNFNTTSPGWYQVNGGLTTTQYQTINRIIVCPNGAVYVGYVGSASNDYFIARASYAGAPFTVIYDQASLNALFGVTGRDARIIDFNCDYLASETVVIMITKATTSKVYPYIGAGVSFIQGAEISNVPQPLGSVSYGSGNWIFTHTNLSDVPSYTIISQDALTVITQQAIPSTSAFNSGLAYHQRIGNTKNLVHRLDGSATVWGLWRSTNNCSAFSGVIGNAINSSFYKLDNIIAMDETGTWMMARQGTPGKGKSSDGGYSWSDISNLPVLVPWVFCYTGGGGTSSRWIAAGTYVYYSKDFGVTPWVNKQGNLPSINPIYSIDIIKVIP